MSKSACVGGWRRKEKQFCGSEFAATRDARRCSGSVCIVIAASVTAAPPAARKDAASNAAMPTAGTSGVQKVDSITETDNAPTAGVTQLTP